MYNPKEFIEIIPFKNQMIFQPKNTYMYYQVTHAHTYERVRCILESIKGNMEFSLLGNKSDLDNFAQV
jgi:hypothetical protein